VKHVRCQSICSLAAWPGCELQHHLNTGISCKTGIVLLYSSISQAQKKTICLSGSFAKPGAPYFKYLAIREKFWHEKCFEIFSFSKSIESSRDDWQQDSERQ